MRRALLLGSLLLLAACGPKPIAVTDVFVGTELNERQEIVSAKEVIRPTDSQVHTHVVVANISEDIEVKGEWWYVQDGKPDRKFFETSLELTAERPVAKFLIQNTNPWPLGVYKFVLTGPEGVLTEKMVWVKQ